MEKIPFNSETARAIIEKHGLSPTTLRVWQNRGTIPEKYLHTDFKLPTEASKADKILEQRITSILKSGLLNVEVVAELAGIPSQKTRDVARGGSSYSKEDIIQIKGEIAKLKIEVARAFEIKSIVKLRLLLNNPAFVLRTVMSACSKLEYEHANRIKLRKIEPSEADFRVIKDAFIKCAIQLNI